MTPWALVLAISFAELEHGLPPGLMFAVAVAESGGRWQVSHERRGGCSVGPLQTYHANCDRRFRPRDLAAHVDAAARILARSISTCAAHPRWYACRVSGGIGLYNAGNARAWSAAVWRIHRDLTRGRHPARAERISDV